MDNSTECTRMSELQKPLKDTDVHLVSFTVDPDTDKPAVLRVYGEKLNAQSGRWDFLTGPKQTWVGETGIMWNPWEWAWK